MIKEFPPIILYRGATTVVTLDLTDFDFVGGYVLFTASDKYGATLLSETFDTNEEHDIVFNDELTASIPVGRGKYDIMWVVGDERYPQCEVSPIVIKNTVGGKVIEG